MSEVTTLQEENASLRLRNEALLRKLADASQALEALAGGEVDAVALPASATPVLLHAAQEKLRRSERLLRAIFDSSLDAKVLVDDGGHIIDVNPAANELFGLSREALLGRPLDEFAAPGYEADAIYRALRERGQLRGLFPIRSSDGVQREVDYGAESNVVPGVHLFAMRDVTERMTTEQALSMHRAMLEEAQAIAHIGSWTATIGLEGEILWSKECYSIFDVPPETPITGTIFMELVHPDDRELVLHNVDEAVERGTAYDVEHRIRRPDGKVRWVHERARVEYDTAGRAIRLVGTAQDVTDRHLAIEALRASEAEFRLLAETMPQIVWIRNPEGGNIFFNQRWVDYTGLSLEESFGDGWLECFHPEDRPMALDAWLGANAEIRSYSVECRLRRVDGVYRWWLIRGEPVRDASGHVLKWFGTCTDIESLKQSEVVHRDKEALLRIAGHVARLGAWSLSVPELHLVWSDEVCAIHGVPLGTVPTLDEAINSYAPEFRAEIQKRVALCMHEGVPFDLELQIVTRSNQRKWVRAIGSAERDSNGKITAVRGAFQDIDDRRKLQEQLLRGQKMQAMGQLAGGIAHDFNNILGVILSYGSLIRDATPTWDERRGDIIEVLKAAERATGLTRQLLAFTQQQVTEKRPIDLNESLAQLHKLLLRTLGEHITLRVVAATRPAVVRIDPVQFDQIVLNLVVNARDAMSKGGELNISLEHAATASSHPHDGDWVRLSVTDTGTGMDQKTQERIFEPFFTTKERGKGTGLGLATCFGIVSDAGGKIQVKSTLGHGATFTVELPLCSDPPDSLNIDSGRVTRNGDGETVLLAEDDNALRRVTARMLRSVGYVVYEAEDGDDAKHKLEELGSKLDVLVSDVVMPGCSGYDLITHARRVAPGTVVILTSGFIETAARQYQAEDVPILWKPVAQKDLVRAVGKALEARARRTTEPGGSILLVEDDTAASQAIMRVLTGAGYAGRTVATVADARHALETGPEPRVVLCDLTLSDGSSAALLEWIQTTKPSLCSRVFVLTGGAIDAAGKRVIKSGVFRVLSKPIQPVQLLDVLVGVGNITRAPSATLEEPSERNSSPAPRTTSSQSGAPPRIERVLIVDDDEAVAKATKRVLAEDFDVTVVGTVADASRMLDDGDLDALIVDIGLPDGSGLDLLRELHGKNAELPVVMMTGSLTPEAVVRAIQGRVTEYLPKPFAPEDLLQTVRRAVDSGRLSRLRSKLLASRFGGDEFVSDLALTEKSFRRALSRIRMVFQPIVRSADSAVFGYEALLRCDEPFLGSPLRLFAAAEVLGRVEDVGRAVRAGVAAVVGAARDRSEVVFLNVHPSEVRGDLLSEATDPLLKMAHRVILEVTERASLESGPKLEAELAHIRKLGYRIAVDDLGEGYAGLSSLVHLRPDIAKIDMSLVRDIHRMPLKRDIITAIVDMARRAGIVVVAEGVETVEERDVLVDAGCDLLQGYLFAKPGLPFPVPRTTFERKVNPQ